MRLAHQPAWPLAFEVAGVVSGEGIAADGRDHGERADDEPVVWIVEGAQCEHPLKADKLAARQRRGTGWRQPSFDLDR